MVRVSRYCPAFFALEGQRFTFKLNTHIYFLYYTPRGTLERMKNTYYKIQYFSPISLTYIDVQKAYNTIDDLMIDVDKSKTYRIMMIDNKKRHIIRPQQA